MYLSNLHRLYQESPVWTYDQLQAWRWEAYEASRHSVFLAWLKTFPLDYEVGSAFRVHDDPLANCINSKYPWLDAAVGHGQIDCKIPRLLLPGPNPPLNMRNINDLTYMGSMGGSLQMHAYIPRYVDLLDQMFHKTEQYQKTVNGHHHNLLLHEQWWPVTAEMAIIAATAAQKAVLQAL